MHSYTTVETGFKPVSTTPLAFIIPFYVYVAGGTHYIVIIIYLPFTNNDCTLVIPFPNSTG